MIETSHLTVRDMQVAVIVNQDMGECHEDSQKPFMGNFLRSSDRGMVMR
jgi:hypothetical protein